MLSINSGICQAILQTLRAGGRITRSQGRRRYGRDIAGAIYVIRQAGYPVVTKMRKGSTKRYAEYHMAPGEGPANSGGMLCISGRHTWKHRVSRERCCNGWSREVRSVSAGPIPREGTGGHTRHGDGLVTVWVKHP